MSEYSDYIAAEAGSAGALMASCLNREPGSKSAAAGSCFAGQRLLDPLADTMSLYIKRKDKSGPDIQDDEAMLEY